MPCVHHLRVGRQLNRAVATCSCRRSRAALVTFDIPHWKQLLFIMRCKKLVFVIPKGRASQTPLPPSCKTWSCQLLSLLHPSQLSTLGLNFFGKVFFVNTSIAIYLSSFPTFAAFWTSFPEPAAISCKLVVCCTALPPRPAEDGLALVTEAENMAMRLRDMALDFLQGPSLGRSCKDVFAWP